MNEQLEKLLARIQSFGQLKNDWLNADSFAPAEPVRKTSLIVLTHLYENQKGIKRPFVYPNPDGGIEAEWYYTNSWVVWVKFEANGKDIVAEAERNKGEESELQVSTEDKEYLQKLIEWMEKLNG